MKRAVKKHFILLAALILGVALASYFFWPNPASAPQPAAVAYVNNDFGFRVALPADWKGYTVSLDTWTGDAINGQAGRAPYATGPKVLIHNPLWTASLPYQDIPIMIFTVKQWADLQAEKFHIGAAPIPPSVLGENAKYVFALPARYNFAFPPGYEEVEQILQGKPLTAF